MNAPAADQNRPKVLVADDERHIADTLQAILDKSGFDATAVYDGQAAVDTARVWVPNIFLSDVVMPGLSGIDAAILVSKTQPRCRILLFSGTPRTAEELSLKARAQGYDFEILQKPIHPTELLERLRMLLAEGKPEA